MADLLDEPVFDDVIRVHLGEPPPPAPKVLTPKAPIPQALASQALAPEVPAQASADAAVPIRHGHVHWVLASEDGELISAPEASSRTVSTGSGDVRLDYHPMRKLGTVARVTGTNRDYLGSIRVVGPDAEAAEAATAEFLRTERWVIE
jgi:hypothetical protein